MDPSQPRSSQPRSSQPLQFKNLNLAGRKSQLVSSQINWVQRSKPSTRVSNTGVAVGLPTDGELSSSESSSSESSSSETPPPRTTATRKRARIEPEDESLPWPGTSSHTTTTASRTNKRKKPNKTKEDDDTNEDPFEIPFKNDINSELELYRLLEHIQVDDPQEWINQKLYLRYDNRAICVGCKNACHTLSSPYSNWSKLFSIFQENGLNAGSTVEICIQMEDYYKRKIQRGNTATVESWNALQIYFHIQNHVLDLHWNALASLRRLNTLENYIFSNCIFTDDAQKVHTPGVIQFFQLLGKKESLIQLCWKLESQKLTLQASTHSPSSLAAIKKTSDHAAAAAAGINNHPTKKPVDSLQTRLNFLPKK